MTYFTLPGTDVRISRIILGCWAFSGDSNWGGQREKDSLATIDNALDNGINALDTALGYGNGISERIVGKALRRRRDKVIVYDKIPAGKLAYADVLDTVDTILTNLGTDYVDIMQIHWANPDIPVNETLEAMERLREQGKIRYFGMCNGGPMQLGELSRTMKPVSNQISYSLLSRAVEYEIQPFCEEKEIGLLAYSPLQQGLLTGKYLSPEDYPAGRMRTRHFSGEREGVRHGGAGFEKETFAAIKGIARYCGERGLNMADASLAWVLARPGVDGVIAGARTPEQLAINIKAVELNPGEEALKGLTELTKGLKSLMGPNGDLWNRESRIR